MKKKISWWMFFLFGAAILSISKFLVGIAGTLMFFLADLFFLLGFFYVAIEVFKKTKKSEDK